MRKSIKISRYDDPDAVYVVSHDPTSTKSEKFSLRFINHRVLIDTHLPEPYQLVCGALVTLLLRDSKVTELEIWQTNAGFWFADAFVLNEGQKEFRRGEGSTPDEALNYLILNIQRF